MKSTFYLSFCFLLNFYFLNAEEVGSEKSSPSKEEMKPLKYETGMVVVNPRSVSVNLKKNNLITLKHLKSSLINYGMEDQYKSLMKSYIDATILLQKRKYKQSRRAFESNYQELNQAAKAVLAKNKNSYNGLFSEASQSVIQKKIESLPKDRFVAILQKKLRIATDISLKAQRAEENNKHISAIVNYKKAKYRLIRILQTIQKKEASSLPTLEKAKKKLFIEDDYVPAKYLKDFDDSRGMVYSKQIVKRHKKREYIKKGIRSKYGKHEFLQAKPLESKTEDLQPDKPTAPDSKEGDSVGGN
ncbi:MAG: hypothetical protein AAF518_01760 [Spirochaetota bacterium]